MNAIGLALISAALAAGPAPQPAQSRFCATIENLIDLANDNFVSILQDRSDTQAESGATRLVLPGAKSCQILRRFGQAGYWCSWGSKPELVAAQITAFADKIGSCLLREPDWVGDEFSPSAFILDRGVEFYVSGGRGTDDEDEVVLSVEFVGEGNDESAPPLLQARSPARRPWLRQSRRI